MNSKKIIFKRKKPEIATNNTSLKDRIEEWAGYWRANPHRFVTEYLGLPFKGDFQSILFYALDLYTHFIYVASRGLGKSTITLLYCVMRCILYPDTKIVVVAPLRSQSLGFVKKIKEFALENLDKSIVEIISPESGSPYILTVSASGLRGEVIMHMLEEYGVIVGTGSACSSKNPHSRILKACGYSNAVLDGVVRLSFCSQTTMEEVEFAVSKLNECIKRLKGIMKK